MHLTLVILTRMYSNERRLTRIYIAICSTYWNSSSNLSNLQNKYETAVSKMCRLITHSIQQMSWPSMFHKNFGCSNSCHCKSRYYTFLYLKQMKNTIFSYCTDLFPFLKSKLWLDMLTKMKIFNKKKTFRWRYTAIHVEV